MHDPYSDVGICCLRMLNDMREEQARLVTDLGCVGHIFASRKLSEGRRALQRSKTSASLDILCYGIAV